MELTIALISKYAQAKIILAARDPELVVRGLSWDSRTVEPGALFVALSGESTDGNAFILAALQKGVAAIIASRMPTDEEHAYAKQQGAALLFVSDSLSALQQLATGYREAHLGAVLAITGSNGKTSTRNLVSAVLSKAFVTAASTGNRNNEIGLPASVLAATPATQVLIVEMGMRGLGQIESLCKIARPTVGIITNVGSAHLELLGNQANIARAKAELIEALPDNSGIAILNGDDMQTEFICEIAQTAKRCVQVVTFGLEEHNRVYAKNIAYDACGCAGFDLYIQSKFVGHVQLKLTGSHSVYNALAAVAAGAVYHVGEDLIVAALRETEGIPMRQSSYMLANGVLLIDDTYNANTDSTKAALDVLSKLDKKRLHIAVLGDMGELGADEVLLHKEIGAMAQQTGVNVLITIGKLAVNYAQGAVEAGMDAASVISCTRIKDAYEALTGFMDQAPIILVKASRFMGLEQLVELLRMGNEASAIYSKDNKEVD